MEEQALLRLRVNWLPTSRAASVAVARLVEQCGFDGLGVCDSPHYVEAYSTVETCLAATSRLVIGTNVTNPVTRHWSVHAAAARNLLAHGEDRCFLGMGTGDSAVRTDGGRPATLATLGACLERVRERVGPTLTMLVAAGGPRGTQLAATCADGVILGVGTSLPARQRLLETAAPRAGFSTWATLRVAVAGDAADVARLRRLMLPRAISAARFNLASGLEGRDVPSELVEPLRSGFAGYDFAWHGRAGSNPNAVLFGDRPDVEDFLLERYAIVGTGSEVAAGLRRLAAGGYDGAFLSIRFEDPLAEIAALGDALAEARLLTAR